MTFTPQHAPSQYVPANPRALPPTVPAAAATRWSPSPIDPQAPPVYLVPTLLGALAILAATLAIPPMISGDGWFWPTVEVVLVIWLVGVGARLARVPAIAVIVLQVLGAAVALTALFTVGGIGGVIPNGAVLVEAGDLLTGAWEQIRTTVSPAPSSTELAFLICLSVGTTALIVDILIAVCRAPALVALPLLCVYSVPASIDLTMLPWEAFAAPAMLYAVLLTASGLSGRRLGAGAGVAQVITGVGLASIATVIALVVAGSVTGVGTAGRLPRSQTGLSTAIGLSPFASLEGSLQRADPVDMLRVSGLDSAHYLRTVGLQKWNGVGFEVDTLSDGQLPNNPTSSADQQQITVTSLAYRDQFLPIYNGTTAISDVAPGWSYDAALESVHRPDAVTPDPYRITAAFTEPTADELRADSVTAGGSLTDTGQLSSEVAEQATAVTANAATAFDKANALREYFTNPANGFTYSLTVPPGDSGDPLVDFLRNKQGFCEQYASAMTVMLRAVGVPARVAIGFTQGSRDANGNYVISSNDAHAWVEVLFNGAGWVEFDPTPLGGGQGGQQGFTDPAQAAPTAGETAGGGPSAGLDLEEPAGDGGAAAALPSENSPGSSTTTDEPTIPTAMWWLLAALLVAAAAAAGPTAVRNQRRRKRLATADAGGPDAAAAAWREIEDLAVDYGIALNPADSARSTANRLARAAHLTDTGRVELRAVVTHAERGWYGGAEARSADHHGAHADELMAQTADQAAPAADQAAAGRESAIATLERVDDTTLLGAAPRTMARELQHHLPLTPIDRLVPRSVRPTWWRD
jgi:transglutaminase-like putative cysteine protease